MIFRPPDLTHLSGIMGVFGYDRVSHPGGDSSNMDQSDIDYYRLRIAEEEIAAQRATHPLAAESHKKLAEEYASLIFANDPSLSLRIQA